MSDETQRTSRLRRFQRWLDPRVKEEGAQLEHWIATTSLGLVFGLLFGFLVAFGAFEGGHAALSWAQRIQQARTTLHARGGITIPPQRVYIAPKTGGRPLPHSGSILLRYFMGTTNQGSTYSCAAQGAAKSIAYEASRVAKRRITVSPRQLYDLDTNGAPVFTSVSDYNRIIAQNGTVSTRVLDYGPRQHPAWISQWGTEPVPAFARYGTRRATHTSYLWYYQGAGYGAVQRAREAIHARRAVSIGSDWYFNAEKSSWTTGKMGLPVHGDWVEYGHTVVLVRYNDTIPMLDGTRGAFLASNSFGTLYGRNSSGAIQRGHGGYVWISYAYIARYAAYGTVEDLGYAKTGGGHFLPPANNPHAPTYRAPFDPGPQTGGAYSPYVHGVILHDTGYDLTSLINYWVSYYHRNGVYEVSGPFLVAIAITESSLNQFAPRCCIPGDTSYGTFQFILSTACSLGVCSNIEANLNNPLVSTRLAAEYVDHFHFTHPNLPPPYQYVLFNAGEGVSDSFAYNPSGVAWSNFQNFLVNWNTALRYYMGGSAVSVPVVRHAVQTFRIKSWCRSYRAWKLKGCPSAYWHGHLGVVPRFWAFTKGLNGRAGGVAAHAVWHPKRHYMSQRFTHAIFYSWPTKRGVIPRVVFR